MAEQDDGVSQREKERLLWDAQDALDRVRLIGDVVVGAFFAHEKDREREKERERRLDRVTAWLREGGPPPDELKAMARGAASRISRSRSRCSRRRTGRRRWCSADRRNSLACSRARGQVDGVEHMEITANDLLPLVLKLPRDERVRLARLALAAAAQDGPADAAAYAKMPVQQDELGHDADEMLAWDAEGWEDVP
ncbi:hypothetical protein WMF31_38865 [Sorangium sp. So ce1036]|uniref:hypothetical protein n=1 Tax=Sorangium sp. So ce1036 TaxID=3133328 RepID=UPI003F09D7BD